MNIQLQSSFHTSENTSPKDRKAEKVAMAFEKIFARQLVQEMTKGLFESADNNAMMGTANTMYRAHIVDTLSQELSQQHKLGMADMVKHYIDQQEGINNKG